MLSKETFCEALLMIKQQENINENFSKALQKMGDGFFIFGTDNKYLEALLMVLKEAVKDKYDYIDWWLYDGAEPWLAFEVTDYEEEQRREEVVL